MDYETLMAAMPGLSASRALQLIDGCNKALILGSMTSVRRVAMFLAQTGEESGSLRHTEEIADGSEYNGRIDLGNTQPGDGPRFKGRSFIQITGRSNYLSFSGWAYSKGLVPTSDYFIQHPAELANDEFAWMGAVWYFVVARSNLNQLADAGDVVTATREINGGLNGLADRQARWNRCLQLGAALLPTIPTAEKDGFDMATLKDLQGVVSRTPVALSPAAQVQLRMAIARAGSLYLQFADAPLNIRPAIYEVVGQYLLWIDAPSYGALVKRYGGPPYVVTSSIQHVWWKLPIVPGTPDPRNAKVS